MVHIGMEPGGGHGASYQEANMATENKIWPLSNFVLFLRTCDTKRGCEKETNR
jgi:hypothetical protein